MKKKLLIMPAVLISLVVVIGGCSKGYESKKTSGSMNITLKADSYPLVKGDNTLTVKATDSAGKPITGAKVNVRFYMPPMPGMAPMESTTQAVSRDDKYTATINAPMEGGWKAEVDVQQPGKDAAVVTFNLDAR